MKRIVPLALCILWTAACAAQPVSTAAPVQVPTDTRPVPTMPTAVWTRDISTPTTSPTPPPSWVEDFVAPVLTSLDGQVPNFQDDFAKNLNHGWFYLIADSRRNPFQAHLEYERLLIQLPEGKEKRDSMVYNPKFVRRNLVLTFDFQFKET